MNKPNSYNQNKNKGVAHPKGNIIISESYEGQLPSPEMMQKYNSLDPTFANRILQMAEKEQLHNHQMSKKTSSGIMLSMFAGMSFAFLSVLVVSYLVYHCVNNSYPTTAGTIAVGVIVGLAGVFLYQKKKIETK